MIEQQPRRAVFSACAAALLFAASSLAQSDAAASRPAERAEVVIIGASLSAGFICPFPDDETGEPNRTERLSKALEMLWEPDRVRIRDRSDLTTFLDPIGKQTKIVERAVEDQPALVVAVDFLFWFGYGYVPGPDLTEERLALLENGLRLLDGFACPIVVGDFPDMHGADERMLDKRQIPDVATLEKLNARVAEWAKERERVHLFPLAQRAAEMKAKGRSIEVEGETLQLGPAALLQSDKLHPTKLGIALVVLELGEVAAKAFEEDALLRPKAMEFEEIVDGIRAGSDLEMVLEAAGR